jgi:hypothetical protein
MARIRIRAGDVSMEAELNDSTTAQKILQALPIEGRGSRWGDEIYFSIPVDADLEPDASDVVPKGTLGYWPPGTAFCIFFGRTPASRGNEIRAASPVNIVGKLLGNPDEFKKVTSGTKVIIEKVEG